MTEVLISQERERERSAPISGMSDGITALRLSTNHGDTHGCQPEMQARSVDTNTNDRTDDTNETNDRGRASSNQQHRRPQTHPAGTPQAETRHNQSLGGRRQKAQGQQSQRGQRGNDGRSRRGNEGTTTTRTRRGHRRDGAHTSTPPTNSDGRTRNTGSGGGDQPLM